MMEFEPNLLWVPIQYLFHEGVICTATWALIVVEFHERHFGVLGPSEVTSAFDIDANGSGFRRRRCVGLAAQEHRSAGGDSDCEDDHDNRLHDFRHAPHSSGAISVTSKIFLKKGLA